MVTECAQYSGVSPRWLLLPNLGRWIFASYKVQWDAVKDIMTPLLLETLEANGLTPYAAE